MRIGNYLIELGHLSKGTEKQLYESLYIYNKELITKFGEKIFTILFIPVAKVQTVGAFLCFNTIGDIYSVGSPLRGVQIKRFGEPEEERTIADERDLILLRTICEKYTVKANDILKHLLLAGLHQDIIFKPISKDTEVILSFLRNAPAYILDLFYRYKSIYYSDRLDKNTQLELLFENVRKIKEEIYEGNATTVKIDENLFFGVLYHIFSPELTIDRSHYKSLFDQRNDRQADIPAEVVRKLSGNKVKVMVGTVRLKEGESLDTNAWQDIVDIVQEVNTKGPAQVNPAELGIELMQNLVNNTLKTKRKYLLGLVYSYSVLKGESLPIFSQTYEILMKYKEFIGDRMNNLLFLILSESLKQYPEQFINLNNIISRKPSDIKGLCKTLENLWKSKVTDKEKRILQILEKNGYYVENLADWQNDWTSAEIESWIKSLNINVIDKGVIAKIKNELYGEQYEQMQNEVKKFKFEGQRIGMVGATKTFTFHLSKKKAHSVAMFNMGICDAPDNKLWNSPDFWQMIIFDEDKNACGGVIYRTIEENGKKYLVCSIQPSQGILSSTSPQSVYDKIIQYSRLIAKILRYDTILIPQDAVIHSNRGSIQTEIAKRNYRTITLQQEYDFSYSPYHYPYQKFFVV